MWAIEQHATIDFETYSEAGYVWNAAKQKWEKPRGSKDAGIKAVGTFAYAEHPSTEVLTLSYKLPGDPIVSRWRPGLPLPARLFAWIANGGLVEAHSSMFEKAIWDRVCRRLYGFPELPFKQVRCSRAKANVNNYPGALANLTSVLPVKVQKDPDGTRLLNKFSIPRNPTKKDPRLRIRPEEDPIDGEKLYAYCDTDILAEEESSGLLMPMSINELRFWLIDQEMNWRGVGVDMESTRNMIAVMDECLERYGEEFRAICGLNPTQVDKIGKWLQAQGVRLEKLDEEHIDEALKRKDLPPLAYRVLEIRSLIGSASVKKLYAIERAVSSGDRVRNAIIHHGARTGRPTGELLQPLNLPKSGPDLIYCDHCHKPSKWPPVVCPWCSARMSPVLAKCKWPEVPKGFPDDYNPVDDVQTIMATRSLKVVERFFGDAFLTISGCVRGMITAGPGKELIASDYSAIEAVVTAMLAKCQWRIDAFQEKKDIYLVSCASMNLGFTYEQYIQYYNDHNRSHHWHRQKKGKVSELALGFGGWVSAWLQFDPDGEESEIKKTILAWRAASPEIVEMWGGQARGRPWDRDYHLERFGFEGAFVNAIQYPNHVFESNGIKFYMRGDTLIIRLLSGRELPYASPRLWEKEGQPGVFNITYMTWNTNPKYGPKGWVAMKTYGGRICENCIAEGTEVLTQRGWVPIEKIQKDDRVHDGVELVNHQGLLYKGIQSCISIDGVQMTPDHEVLTDNGWEVASQSPRPYRPTIWDVGSFMPRLWGKARTKNGLGLPMRLWSSLSKGWDRRYENLQNWRNPKLRLPNQRANIPGQSNAWVDIAPNVRGMEWHETKVPLARTPGVLPLWGAGDSSVCTLAKKLRSFLERHVTYLEKRIRFRSSGQRERIFTGELSMGNKIGKQPEPSIYKIRGNSYGSNAFDASRPNLQSEKINYPLSTFSWLADGNNVSETRCNQTRVYDIVNCGPRSRFVVRGKGGPFIVHNCVQATAHDIQRYGIENLEAAGYPVILHVYDEDVGEIPIGWGSLEEFERIMSTMPPWAHDWPVRASGGWRGHRYRKA